MSDWKLISTANPSGAANASFTALTGYKIFKFHYKRNRKLHVSIFIKRV